VLVSDGRRCAFAAYSICNNQCRCVPLCSAAAAAAAASTGANLLYHQLLLLVLPALPLLLQSLRGARMCPNTCSAADRPPPSAQWYHPRFRRLALPLLSAQPAHGQTVQDCWKIRCWCNIATAMPVTWLQFFLQQGCNHSNRIWYTLQAACIPPPWHLPALVLDLLSKQCMCVSGHVLPHNTCRLVVSACGGGAGTANLFKWCLQCRL
jgi:hypothetical protein